MHKYLISKERKERILTLLPVGIGIGAINTFVFYSPYHLPINYDRTKVASKVYNMISSNGLVDIEKIDDTYITITKKGDDVSEKLLRETS